MGVSSYDKSARSRKLAEQYKMTTPEAVKRALKDSQQLTAEVVERGDFALCDFLADLGLAVALAGLTEKEREAVVLFLVEDLPSETVSRMTGRDAKRISESITNAVTKIATVYQTWESVNGGGQVG